VLTGPREPYRAVDPLLAPNRARTPGLARAGHEIESPQIGEEPIFPRDCIFAPPTASV